ncbi:hypothetical protein Tco_0113065 [Tanacetum coccineum]
MVGSLMYLTASRPDLVFAEPLTWVFGILAGHQRNNAARQYQLQRLNTSPCLDVVLKSFGCDHSSTDYGFDFNKIPLYCDNKSAIALCCNNVTSTLALNTSTYGTISSESKWKIEWLNSTSWKQIISLQTFSPKHYQENGSNFFFHA